MEYTDEKELYVNYTDRELLLSQKVASLELENFKLKMELKSVTEKLAMATDELEHFYSRSNEAYEAMSEDVTVAVRDKGILPVDSSKGRYSNYCTLVFDVTNNTDNDIRGIQGYLVVEDIFGAKIITYSNDFTGKTILSGQTMVYKMRVEINEFMQDNMKFYNTAYEDLKFKYKLNSIVFSDGTMKTDLYD